MSKLDKNTLKSIVKECLIEILSEGLTNGNTQKLSESINNNTNTKIKTEEKINSIPVQNKKNIAKILPQKKQINENFIDKTQQIIKKTTNDPVLAEIFADTALTTLQEQNSADNKTSFNPKSNDQYKNFMNENDPSDIFGEASNNWANLAFRDK
jgi:hypothetical protein